MLSASQEIENWEVQNRRYEYNINRDQEIQENPKVNA